MNPYTLSFKCLQVRLSSCDIKKSVSYQISQNIVIAEDYISEKMPNYLQKNLYEYWNIKNTHMSKKSIIPCSPYVGAINHQVLIVIRLKVHPSRLSLVTAMDYRLAYLNINKVRLSAVVAIKKKRKRKRKPIGLHLYLNLRVRKLIIRYGFIFPLTIIDVPSIFDTLSRDSKKNMVRDASVVDMLVPLEKIYWVYDDAFVCLLILYIFEISVNRFITEKFER
ncbi:uncharacterized protein EV154DRAFT_481988 [Mucor mucedo]|uniref:uncharacterized protein n=1 Tax=Mucor mucedo TaxID=29922 RepID=UPI0022207ABC|nr:uncharacterized protein EV154DRAFT_481988 [Mucor mucedo]KAI7890565.1 hypothetical protein EV154DRAFT_481988 [Mucor mucedo]